jgi:S1-C subfamily serine protease
LYFDVGNVGIPLMKLKNRTLLAATALTLTVLGLPSFAQGLYSGSLEPRPSRWGALQFIGPDTIADLAAAIAPTVVKIDVSVGSMQDTRSRLRQAVPGGKGNEQRRYRLEPPTQEAKGTGSGVIIRPEGIILTSNHLLEGAEVINVTLGDGRTFKADVLGRDLFSDLAALKIDAQNLPVVKFGSAENMRPGDWVIAVGAPLGLDHTVTLGIISALGREQKSLNSFGARSGAVRFIQTDAAINPGNSGGPLLNLKGEVIGINTFIHGSAQNIGFSIPAEVASDVSDKLVRFHTIPHPFIGVIMADLDAEMRQKAGLAEDVDGVLVRSVEPKSPAFLAGMLAGDLILAVDDRPVKRSGDVSEAVRVKDIGDKLNFKVRREGEDRSIRVQVEQLPDDGGR